MMHAAVVSAAAVGETPRTKKPPDANLLVRPVGFLEGVEMRRE